jgi:hypothetical protein
MHQVDWDGTDDAGHTVGAGVFWSQLQAGAYASHKRVVIQK